MRSRTHSPPSPTTPTRDGGKRQKTEASEESPSQQTPKRTPLKSNPLLPPKIERRITMLTDERDVSPSMQFLQEISKLGNMPIAVDVITTVKAHTIGAMEYIDIADSFRTVEGQVRALNLALKENAIDHGVRIWNLATVPSRDLRVGSHKHRFHYLKVKFDPKPASVFHTVGVVMFSGITMEPQTKPLQICIKLSHKLGPCMFANIAAATTVGTKLVVSSYKTGISFNTISPKVGSNVIEDNFPVRRPVPFQAYDARGATAFALGKIRKLSLLDGELEEGDRVLVTFTVSCPDKKKEAGYDKVISFNVQDVVLLERESDEDDNEGEEGDIEQEIINDNLSDNDFF